MAKILLVEDEDDVRCLLLELLAQENHQVTASANGNEALALANFKRFDLVITDLIMPGMDGIEMIMELHSTMPDTKIIAMSGGGFDGSKNFLLLAQKLGATRTLMKPFDRQTLRDAIDAALEPTEPPSGEESRDTSTNPTSTFLRQLSSGGEQQKEVAAIIPVRDVAADLPRMSQVPILFPAGKPDASPSSGRPSRTGIAKPFPAHVSHNILSAGDAFDLSAHDKTKKLPHALPSKQQELQKTKWHPQEKSAPQENLRTMDPHLDRMVRHFITTRAI
jgi:CheY-like chemotaxis protein